jgi:hypothetical protein
MPILISYPEFLAAYLNDFLCGKAFQLAGVFSDAAIAGIADQMKVVRH